MKHLYHHLCSTQDRIAQWEQRMAQRPQTRTSSPAVLARRAPFSELLSSWRRLDAQVVAQQQALAVARPCHAAARPGSMLFVWSLAGVIVFSVLMHTL